MIVFFLNIFSKIWWNLENVFKLINILRFVRFNKVIVRNKCIVLNWYIMKEENLKFNNLYIYFINFEIRKFIKIRSNIIRNY